MFYFRQIENAEKDIQNKNCNLNSIQYNAKVQLIVHSGLVCEPFSRIRGILLFTLKDLV